MSLRGKLKQKEEVESENDRLRKELNEYKAKFIDSQKKQFKFQEQNRDLTLQL